MSDSAETADFEVPTAADGQPVTAADGQPVTASAGASWPPDPSPADGGAGAEHPELLVGAAFVGGLALAKILKRLAA